MENSICTIEQLKKFIDLSPEEEKKLKQITNKHPMRVTPYYLSLLTLLRCGSQRLSFIVKNLE